MCDPITAIAAFASLASTIGGFTKRGGRSSGGMPAGQAPPVPAGPPADLTTFQRPSSLEPAPNFLQLVAGMSPLQQRSKIATYGTSGENSAFRDPATVSYYRNLVLTDLVGPEGTVKPGASYLPVEKQYLTEALGQPPRNESTESFLSALMRS